MLRCTLCKNCCSFGEVSLHRFPRDSVVKKLWCEFVGKENVSANSRLCSSHFEETDFISKPSGIKYLRKNAVPKFPNLKQVHENSHKENENIMSSALILPPCQASSSGQKRFGETKSVDNVPTPTKRLRSVSINLSNSPAGSLSTTSGSLLETFIPSNSNQTCTEFELKTFLNDLKGDEVSRKASKTFTASESEATVVHPGTNNGIPKKFRRRVFIGDYSTEDLNSPRKAKQGWKIAKKTIADQRKKIRSLHQVKRRLKARVSCLTSLVDVLKKKFSITEDAESALQASLSGTSRDIFKRILKRRTRQKFTPELRAFALTLSFYSTKAYNYVRDTFNKSLPHTSTITKWYRCIDGNPGFSKEALQAVKLKVAELGEKNQKVLCNLVMDEMSIMKRIEWTGSEFVGGTEETIDIGVNLSGVHLPEAKEALVFMLVSINGNWKVPVGYLLVNGLNGTEKANVVLKLLEFLHETEAIITSITFDGAPSNFSMASILGADMSPSSVKTYFNHPVNNEKIFIFPDILCHMLKLVRNCIGDKLNFVDNENNTISWIYFKKLEALQTEEGLLAGTKLRKRHIQYFREKMKVKLAAQTFSRSVTDAFIYLRDDLKIEDFKNVGATAKFTKLFNDLFDIFNSRSRYSKVFFRRSLSMEVIEKVFSFFKTAKRYILELKLDGELVVKTNRNTGFLGFIICISSLECFYKKYVVESPLLKYVLTYKFSQDHLEIFFSIVRSKGGSNNNPTARQFRYIFKRLLIHAELKGSEHANSIAIDNTSILHCSSGSSITKTSTGDNLFNSKEFQDANKEIIELEFLSSSAWHLTPYCEDVVGYISGFVVKNLKKCIACADCLKILETDETISNLQNRKKYGRLINASHFVVQVCQTAEKCLKVFINESNLFNYKYKNVSAILMHKAIRNLPMTCFNAFGDHLYDDPMQDHPMGLLRLILSKYLNIRLHHEASKLKDRVESRVRSMLTKTILFKNQ